MYYFCPVGDKISDFVVDQEEKTGKRYYSHNTGKEFLYSVLYFAGGGIMQCTKLKVVTIPKTIKLINNEKKNFYIITYRDDGGGSILWMRKK